MNAADSKPLNLPPESADLLADACVEIEQMSRIIGTVPANDSPYWPSCVSDPGFLPWLARVVTIAKSTSPDTPTPDLVRMARSLGTAPPEWVLAVQFVMGQAATGRTVEAGFGRSTR